MKKILASLLAAAVLLALPACSNNQPAQSGGSSSSNAAGSSGSSAVSSEAGEFKFENDISFICPQSAGGDTDFNCRMIARYLEEKLDTTIVCSNVTGSNGAVALTQYKDEKPDPYTYIVTNSAVLSGNYATGLMDFAYDAYDPVAIYGVSSGEMILVPSDAPYDTLEELVAASQANPQSIVYGGPTGGASYLACYLCLDQEYNAGMAFVEAGDGAERLASLLGGHIDVCNSALLSCNEYIEAGQLKPLATLLSTPPTAYPDIPTASSAFPKMIQDTYYVILAIKGTDPAAITTMNEAIQDIVNNNTDFQTEYYDMNMQAAMCMNVEDTIRVLENEKVHFEDLASLMG